jgi:hypothetical protein
MSRSIAAQRKMKKNIPSMNCGKTFPGYRLVLSGDHDRIHDHEPEFRCEDGSRITSERLKEGNVKTG